ncbi:MAG: DUF3784 domain-containing protein [Bacteroidaceae bacterium]|nr:DUF3784 domain-containing protein [Bacteroidaceae bacterium]
MITIEMGIYLGFAILFIILSVIFILGKGDMLIAGYNTASEGERKKVDISKLRKLMAILSIIVAAFHGLIPFMGSNIIRLVSTCILIVIILIIIILANTWATKK